MRTPVRNKENRTLWSGCRKGQHFIVSSTLWLINVILCYCSWEPPFREGGSRFRARVTAVLQALGTSRTPIYLLFVPLFISTACRWGNRTPLLPDWYLSTVGAGVGSSGARSRALTQTRHPRRGLSSSEVKRLGLDLPRIAPKPTWFRFHSFLGWKLPLLQITRSLLSVTWPLLHSVQIMISS